MLPSSNLVTKDRGCSREAYISLEEARLPILYRADQSTTSHGAAAAVNDTLVSHPLQIFNMRLGRNLKINHETLVTATMKMKVESLFSKTL